MAKKRTVAKKTAKKKTAQTISFDYIKSNYFRVVYVDGVFGGPSPRGENIQMSVWSQRRAIPQQVTQKIDSAGRLGEEVSRKERGTLIRELEAGLVFDVVIAKVMIEWLQKQVEQVESQAETTTVGE